MVAVHDCIYRIPARHCEPGGRVHKKAMHGVRTEPPSTKDAAICRNIEGLAPKVDVVGVDATWAPGSICRFTHLASVDGYLGLGAVIDCVVGLGFHEDSE